ncbi:MAG: DUF5684 domain-containing protein [Saprospiraceae bacterium]
MPDNFLKITAKWLFVLIAINYLTNYAIYYVVQSNGSNFLSQRNGLFSFIFPFISVVGFFLSTGLGIRNLSRSNKYDISVGSVFAFMAILITIPMIFNFGMFYYRSFSDDNIAKMFNNSSFQLSILIGFLFNLLLGTIVISLASQWRIFRKAGYKGWYALIPIYNLIIMCDIIDRDRSWVFLFFVPLFNLIALATITNGMARVFGRSDSFSVGLFFLPFIFFPILAFGKSEYFYGEHEVVKEDLDLEDHLVQ